MWLFMGVFAVGIWRFGPDALGENPDNSIKFKGTRLIQ
ncbi:hypothetical protein KPSA1_01394 [Pseudomonas syringae pv. actinidiae]|uniref:Uncharacterized protein n=1 Tax=Pseudomonas syringae pv. actinidiae TaxID=103796 RepID=A0A2V0Q707_PSESF|nr:hypothetical protein KPSA1_01394 [Pseudomonas syringae pv. actinidiae]